jgi:hypothetical protein
VPQVAEQRGCSKEALLADDAEMEKVSASDDVAALCA